VIQPLSGRVFYEDCRNFQSRTACGKEEKSREVRLFFYSRLTPEADVNFARDQKIRS